MHAPSADWTLAHMPKGVCMDTVHILFLVVFVLFALALPLVIRAILVAVHRQSVKDYPDATLLEDHRSAKKQPSKK